MFVSESSLASTFVYNFTWDGHPDNQWPLDDSPQKAFATVTVNHLGSLEMKDISAVSMTVEGATFGNGTFSKEDFSWISLFYIRPAAEVKPGQTLELSLWETLGPVFFSKNERAPSNVDERVMQPGGGESGSMLYLRSMSVTSVVPEPETYAMLLAGLSLLGAVSRKRRNVKGSLQ